MSQQIIFGGLGTQSLQGQGKESKTITSVKFGQGNSMANFPKKVDSKETGDILHRNLNNIRANQPLEKKQHKNQQQTATSSAIDSDFAASTSGNNPFKMPSSSAQSTSIFAGFAIGSSSSSPLFGNAQPPVDILNKKPEEKASIQEAISKNVFASLNSVSAHIAQQKAEQPNKIVSNQGGSLFNKTIESQKNFYQSSAQNLEQTTVQNKQSTYFYPAQSLSLLESNQTTKRGAGPQKNEMQRLQTTKKTYQNNFNAAAMSPLQKQIQQDIRNGSQHISKQEELLELKRKQSELKLKLIAGLKQQKASVALQNHCEFHKHSTKTQTTRIREENEKLQQIRNQLNVEIAKLDIELANATEQQDQQNHVFVHDADQSSKLQGSMKSSQYIQELKSKLTTQKAHLFLVEYINLRDERDTLQQNVNKIGAECEILLCELQTKKNQEKNVDLEIINIFKDENAFRKQCHNEYRLTREKLEAKYRDLRSQVKQLTNRRKQLAPSLII